MYKKSKQFSYIRLILVNYISLGGTSFRKSDITRANFTKAVLENSDFREATLTHSCFFGAINLHQSRQENPNESILSNSYLRDLLVTKNGSRKLYINANLKEVNLKNANLYEADLQGANLTGTILQNSILEGANLKQIQAVGADFRGSKLTGACLEAWNIDSTTKLDDIDCKYVYLKDEKKERRPRSGKFAPGEFTRLFQKALETVDLIFVDGIDWKAFLKSFQELQIQYGDVTVQAIEKKSGDAFVVRLEVPAEADKAEIERQAKQRYKVELNRLEEIYRERLEAKDGAIEIYRHQNTKLLEIIKLNANKPINISNQVAVGQGNMTGDRNINTGGGNYNENIAGNYIQGNYYAAAEKQNLTEAAAEIQQLLEQLEKSYPTDTTTGKMALATEAMQRIDNNPNLTARILSALKVGSVKAFEQFLSHPASSFVIGALEDWQKTKGT